MRRAVSKFIPGRPRPTGVETTGPPEARGVSTDLQGSGGSFKIDFNAIDDFYIVLENPHKSWLPGDEVSGQIILVSKKNLANISITLLLMGHVKINASSHSKLRPTKLSLFNHTILIFGGEDQAAASNDDFANGLYKGEHRFPFIVKLPNKRVFTSLDFGRGSIEYLLRAAIGNGGIHSTALSLWLQSDLVNKTKHLKINNPSYTSEKLIPLVNPIDVSKLPKAKPKKLIIRDPRYTKRLSRTHSSTSTINTFNTMSSNNSDNTDEAEPLPTPQSDTTKPECIRISLEIPRQGYLRGELIPIKLSIHHLKKLRDVNGIIITFVRVCRLDNGPDGLFESFRKDLQQAVLPLYVDPNTYESEINTSVRVPADAFPTISGCPLVSFQYFIEVLINLSGKPVALDALDLKQEENTTPDLAKSLLNNDFNFSFNVSNPRSERLGFINTDKFKRMRKFVQVTSEVIIGTHRLAVESPDLNHILPPLRRLSSMSDSPTILSQTASSPQPQLPHVTVTSAHPSPNERNLYINSIPEMLVMHEFHTPPYERSLGIPNYDEINGNEVLLPQQPQVSEKERMRLHELSLLPSAPPEDDDEENDDDTHADNNPNDLRPLTFQIDVDTEASPSFPDLSPEPQTDGAHTSNDTQL